MTRLRRWVLAAACTVAVMPHPAAATVGCPAVIGHRGDPAHATENTPASFRSAIAEGARTVELDVRFTADGVPVVLHDPTLDRTTDGTGAVASLTWAQIAAARTVDGQRVPTLYEALKLTGDYGARTLVEVKVRPTGPQMLAFLARFGTLRAWGRVLVTSLDAATLADVRRVSPLPTALIEGTAVPAASDIRASGREFLPWARDVTAARVAAWHRAGLTVDAGVVNDPAGWARMRADHVDGVLTDDPGVYLTWARTHC